MFTTLLFYLALMPACYVFNYSVQALWVTTAKGRYPKWHGLVKGLQTYKAAIAAGWPITHFLTLALAAWIIILMTIDKLASEGVINHRADPRE